MVMLMAMVMFMVVAIMVVAIVRVRPPFFRCRSGRKLWQRVLFFIGIELVNLVDDGSQFFRAQLRSAADK